MPSLSFVFKKIKTTLKKSGTRMEKVADQAFKIKKEKKVTNRIADKCI